MQIGSRLNSNERGAVKFFLRKRLPVLFSALRSLKRLPHRLVPYSYRRYGPAFQGDRMLQEFVRYLGRSARVSATVETGTWKGSTTLFLAEVFPGTIYTVEADSEYFRESRWRFRKQPRIVGRHGSSLELLRELIPSGKLGSLPFFFLDAHVYEEAPLLQELELADLLPRSVILIHDFEVPGRPYFEYDKYFLAGKLVPNGRDLLVSYLSSGKYSCFLPTYRLKDVFPDGKGKLRGYAFLLSGFSKEEERILIGDWGERLQRLDV